MHVDSARYCGLQLKCIVAQNRLCNFGKDNNDTNVQYLEIEANNIAWGMRIVCCQNPSEFFF